ncbi:MAG TPA: hypothetical protein VFU47_08600 [Armatimonadota bacterium]|nr:hypothetical protein [Armatimonadota bacterium]
MSPRTESMVYRRVAIQAIDMALAGDAADGYVCLVEALCRATALRDAGEPWGEELVAQYQRALDDFANVYDVARE